MQSVITNGTGLTHFGSGQPYAAAGKTGTAQVYSLKQNERYNKNLIPEKLRDNSLFIVFAPVDKPRIAVAVLAEHTDVAGQVARKVLDAYLIEKPKEVPQTKEIPPTTKVQQSKEIPETQKTAKTADAKTTSGEKLP